MDNLAGLLSFDGYFAALEIGGYCVAFVVASVVLLRDMAKQGGAK